MAINAASELLTLAADPGHFWFGGWRSINIGVWGANASAKHVGMIDRTNVARTEAYPKGLSTVHVIMPKASPPDAAMREALDEMHKRWGHTVACGAIVIERGGLAGLAMRSAITTMTMLAPKNYRVKVFETVEEASPWVSEQHTRSTGVPLVAAELQLVLQHARGSDPALIAPRSTQ
jgi:hypothetical protein